MDSGALRRLVLATKREVDMSERSLLFLMTEGQAVTFARLVEAAERGDGDAACRLGDMYREGLGGLRYSPKQTYHWYARSAMTGDANGQNNLGACYEHGLGCTQSYAKAVKWYRLSVAQGLGTASMNLGYCYLRGHGVPADKEEALRLFREAVEGGEARAQQEVERLKCQTSLRVSQPVPAGTRLRSPPVSCSASPTGTQQARPCVLALGVPPRDGLSVRQQPSGVSQKGERDGPQEQLRHPEAGPAEVVTNAPNVIKHATDEPGANVSTSGSVVFVDETQQGRHLGLIGVAGVPPPPPWEDENVRRELVDILSTDTVNAVDGVGGPSEEELFPIFAEGGLKPDDLVEGMAERYAEYLKDRETRRE
jgi:hypothetical protein